MNISSLDLNLVGGSHGLANVENQVKGLIEAAEANIERLTAQIRALECMREKERSILATLRLMVVPIGKLPTELLLEIFKHSVDIPVISEPKASNHYSMYRHDTKGRKAFSEVLCLSQVSPYWRQIVHNAPQLWARHLVDVNLGRTKMSEAYQTGLKTFLTRSSPFPIPVLITRRSDGYTSSSSQPGVAHTLFQTAQRWENLELDVVSFDDFTNLIPGTFEALEWLSIRNWSKQIGPVTSFQSAPRLRTLYIDFEVSYSTSKIGLLQAPWSQLTTLAITDVSLGGCRAVLLQCSSVVSVTFNTSHEWDFPLDATQSPVVVLPFLKTLNLHFDDYPADEIGCVEAFFMPLALPSLQTLNLEFYAKADDFWPDEVFTDFQIRSPNIEKCTLAFSKISSQGLIALLRHGPALTTLEVQNSWRCIDNDFLTRFDMTIPTLHRWHQNFNICV
ncbi:hypothetical protein C8R43DRAFT_150478 [Mycena crocata]|nr:hypothetical protein C8R43DRAFT_150478 [Mycena crocata]